MKYALALVIGMFALTVQAEEKKVCEKMVDSKTKKEKIKHDKIYPKNKPVVRIITRTKSITILFSFSIHTLCYTNAYLT